MKFELIVMMDYCGMNIFQDVGFVHCNKKMINIIEIL